MKIKIGLIPTDQHNLFVEVYNLKIIMSKAYIVIHKQYFHYLIVG